MQNIYRLFRFVILFILFANLSLPFALAQEEEGECAFSLREANKLYSLGLIEDIPAILQPCIQRGFTKEDRLEAYKLIILCYLYNDDQEKAQKDMLAFMKRYPEYQLVPTDPVEFRYLFESFQANPLFDYGAIFGANFTHGSIRQAYSPFNLNQEKPKYTRDGFGLQVGMLFNVNLSDNINLCFEPMYAQSNFQLEYENGIVGGFAQPEHYEKQQYILLPVTATYDLEFGNVKPYFRLGGQLGYLIDSKTSSIVKIVNVNESGGISNAQTNEGPDEENIDNRNSLNYWAVIGGGVKFKVNKGFFFADLRYNIGLNTQLNKSENRFTQDNHNWIYMYQDSDFRINSVMLSLGYARTFYNPKRIRK